MDVLPFATKSVVNVLSVSVHHKVLVYRDGRDELGSYEDDECPCCFADEVWRNFETESDRSGLDVEMKSCPDTQAQTESAHQEDTESTATVGFWGPRGYGFVDESVMGIDSIEERREGCESKKRAGKRIYGHFGAFERRRTE